MIELVNEVKPRSSFKKRLAWFGFNLALYIGSALATSYALMLGYGWCAHKALELKSWGLERLTRVEVVREYVQPLDLPVGEIIRRVSDEMGVNPVITKAIAMRESRLEPDAIRFEPKVFSRLKVGSEDQRRMLASSHGVMQIMGFNQDICGLKSWAELYDPAVNVRCALYILKKNAQEARSIKNPAARLREALRRYNGSGEHAENYADAVMANIADELLNDLGRGL